MRRLVCIALASLVTSAPAFESEGEAISALSAPEFEARENAVRYLIEHGTSETVGLLEPLAARRDEAAIRANKLLDYLKYGFKPGGNSLVLAHLKNYHTLSDDHAQQRTAILETIRRVSTTEDIDFLRLCESEAARPQADGKLGLLHILARHLYRDGRTPTPPEYSNFRSMAAGASGRTLASVASQNGGLPLAKSFIPLVPPTERPPLYRYWANVLQKESRAEKRAEGEIFSPLIKPLFDEPESVRRELSHSLKHPLLAWKILTFELGIPDSQRSVVLKHLAEKQVQSKPATATSAPLEIARILLMWGDESVVPSILERGIRENDEASIRAFASTVFLTGEIDHWTRRYRNRVSDDPSPLHRRTLAHLLRVAGKWEEAFGVLTETDHATPLYQLLAVESGNWLAAYRTLSSGHSTPDPAREISPERQLRHHLRSAFLASHAGLKKELDTHLATLSLPFSEKGATADHFTRRHIQGLLVLRRPDLARRVAEAYGKFQDVFEILTLEHRYEDAFQLALRCAQDPGRLPLARSAVKFFSKAAPAKAAALRTMLGRPEIPGSPAGTPPLHSDSYPESVRAPEEIFTSLFGAEEVSIEERSALVQAAAIPRNKALRDSVIEWWKSSDRNALTYDQLLPSLQLAGEWELIAEVQLQGWRIHRADGEKLFVAAQSLFKAGDVEEGRRLMRLAPLMPLDRHWLRPGVYRAMESADEGETRTGLRDLLLHIDPATHPGHSILLREHFRSLPRTDSPTEGAVLVASSQFQFLGSPAGHAFENHTWAIEGATHIEESLGLHALKSGHVVGAERHLAESWRISIEPTRLGSALIEHHQKNGDETAARRIFDLYREKLEACVRDLPGDDRFPKKLSDWRDLTGIK